MNQCRVCGGKIGNERYHIFAHALGKVEDIDTCGFCGFYLLVSENRHGMEEILARQPTHNYVRTWQRARNEGDILTERKESGGSHSGRGGGDLGIAGIRSH